MTRMLMAVSQGFEMTSFVLVEFTVAIFSSLFLSLRVIVITVVTLRTWRALLQHSACALG